MFSEANEHPGGNEVLCPIGYRKTYKREKFAYYRILSKYIDFGMDWMDVLDCATANPAKLIGMPELASMAEGTVGDVVILKCKEKEMFYTDLAGHVFTGHQVLVPQMTFKDGECVYCQADFA